MRLAATSAPTVSPALLDAADALETSADLVAPTDATREDFGAALKQAGIAQGLLRSYRAEGYQPHVHAAMLASAELMTLTFTAIATVEGGAPRFDRPAPERLGDAVRAARVAADMLREG